jgi:hypothetical protein
MHGPLNVKQGLLVIIREDYFYEHQPRSLRITNLEFLKTGYINVRCIFSQCNYFPKEE